jgi:hypothetical protein
MSLGCQKFEPLRLSITTPLRTGVDPNLPLLIQHLLTPHRSGEQLGFGYPSIRAYSHLIVLESSDERNWLATKTVKNGYCPE